MGLYVVLGSNGDNDYKNPYKYEKPKDINEAILEKKELERLMAEITKGERETEKAKIDFDRFVEEHNAQGIYPQHCDKSSSVYLEFKRLENDIRILQREKERLTENLYEVLNKKLNPNNNLKKYYFINQYRLGGDKTGYGDGTVGITEWENDCFYHIDVNTGKQLYDKCFKEIGAFGEGKAFAQTFDGKNVFINPAGETIIDLDRVLSPVHFDVDVWTPFKKDRVWVNEVLTDGTEGRYGDKKNYILLNAAGESLCKNGIDHIAGGVAV